MLIALTGKAGVGKDTAAHALVAAHKLYLLSFAEPLKLACIHKFGLMPADVLTQEGKMRFVAEYGCTVGEILQREGTEGTKPIWGEGHWIKRMDQRLRNISPIKVVIPDCRFDAEARYVRSQGGYIVRIIRPNHVLEGRDPAHVSEQGISEQYIDATIINDGSIEDLKDRVLAQVERWVADHD